MPEMGTDLFRKYMKSKYVKSIERACGEVVWIDLSDIDSAVKRAAECDGLLLPGGADVNPVLYGAEKNEKCGKINDARDNAEPKMLSAFLAVKKPVLAVCRGIQVLNVTLGGTLIQDIKDIQKDTHMSFFTRSTHIHNIIIEKNTALYDVFHAEKIAVNSMHHQAIDKVADALKVTAKSEDGFVEAVELSGYPFCVGVQWHPEHMSRKNSGQQKLFHTFVNSCKQVNS